MNNETTTNSWKVEVITDSSGVWASNGMRYAVEDAAIAAAKSLASRWVLVMKWRVVPSEDAPNA